MHENGFGYNLTFIFDTNSYFTTLEFTKQFVMTKPNVVEKCIGSVIDWAPGTDPTKEKKKKKVTKGKTTKTITKTIKVESFFNFFETIQAQINQNGAQPAGGDDDDSEKEDPENALGE